MAQSHENRDAAASAEFVYYYKCFNPPRIRNGAISLSFLFDLKHIAWLAFQQLAATEDAFDSEYTIYVIVPRENAHKISPKLATNQCHRLGREIEQTELIALAKNSTQIFYHDNLAPSNHPAAIFSRDFLIRYLQIKQKSYTLCVPTDGLTFS